MTSPGGPTQRTKRCIECGEVNAGPAIHVESRPEASARSQVSPARTGGTARTLVNKGRGSRHPISAVTQARRWAEAGWTDVEIVSLLADRGVTVSKTTVGRWVKQERHDAWARDVARWNGIRASLRGSVPQGRPNTRPEFKVARAGMLRALGLSYDGIARLLTFDYGEPVTGHQMRRMLTLTGRWPT